MTDERKKDGTLPGLQDPPPQQLPIEPTAPPRTDGTMPVAEDDIEEVDSGFDEELEPPPPPVEPEPALEGAAAEERVFYVREAEALAERQPERAALMWVEAATVAQRAGAGETMVTGDLEQALELRPDSAWLLPRARRMLMALGSFEQALKLGQREVKLGGDNTTRAAVLFEAAAVIRYRLKKNEHALAMVERALQLQPRYIAALARGSALYAELSKHAQLAKTLETLADALTDPEQRALALYAAGTVLEARLEQDDAARAAYLRATEADRKHLPSVLALCELNERTGQWDGLCRAFEHLADLVADSTTQARLWYQAGSMHLDHTGDLESATRDLSRAVRAAPEDAAAVRRLAYAYEAKGRTSEMVHALRHLLELTPESQGRAALLTQIGGVLDCEIHDTEGAIAAYRQAVDELPGYLPALQALGALYRARGDYENLVAISNPETEGMLPVGARAVRLVGNAEILADHLDRLDDAVSAYRRALELAPTMHLAFWGLADVLRQSGRNEELADVLGLQAEVCTDVRTRTHLLLEQARLLAGPINMPDRAVEVLGSAGLDDQARSVALELMVLYDRTERFAELAPLLLDQADATKDPDEAEGRRIQAAQLLELRLEENDRALEIYKQVMKLNPRSMAAIHGAGRILHRRGAWNELIKLHHHELTTDPERPDAAILLCRVGRILAEHLGNRTAAINAYSKALRQDPTCTPALVALEGLARAESRWADLVRVLEQYAQARNDGPSAATALCRAGEVAGWELGELDQAADLFAAALGRHEGAEIALHGLQRVRVRQRDWAGANDVLDQLVARAEHEDVACMLQLQLARLREFWLGEPPLLRHYEQAAKGAFAAWLREEMTRIRWLTGASGMAGWLTELGGRTSDDLLGTAHLLEAAHICEFADPSDPSLEAIEQAYERRPDDPAVIWSLERGLLRTEQWAELAELREKEAQLDLDRWVRVQRLAAAAQAYWQAGATEDAERVSRECLNFDAHCLPALRLLAQLAEESQQWAELAELCDRLAEACTDRENRLAHCLRAAELWAIQVEDSSRALASLAVALADNPGQDDAFSRAELLLRERGEFEELSRLYQRRIRACDDASQKVELLRSHARLLRDDLRHPDRAIAEVTALLALAPTDLKALGELAELHSEQQHWSDAASALGLVIERAEDNEVRHRARLKQADLWLTRLHEPKRARAVLEEAAADRPGDLEVQKLLINLATTVGDWEDARQLLEQMTAAADGGARIWALLQLAEVTQLGLRDDALRERCEREAVLLAARDRDALRALRLHYPAREQKHRLVEIGEPLLERVEGEDARALRELLARILVEDLNQPSRALRHLHTLLESGAQDTEITLLHARVLEKEKDGNHASKQYAALLEQDAGNVEAYRGLVRVGTPEVSAAAAAVIDLWDEVATPEETVQLKGLGGEGMPKGVFSSEQLRLDERFAELDETLQTLAPYLDPIYARDPVDVLDPTHPAVASAQQLARCLGLGRVRVEIGAPRGAVVGIGQPLPLQLAPEVAAQPDQTIFRFWVGRALARALQGGAVVQQLDDRELTELFDALYARKPQSSSAQQLKKQLSKLLSRKLRKHLETHQPADLGPRLWAGYRLAINQRADRLGLVLSRHPGVALCELAALDGVAAEDISQAPKLAPLLRFVVSEDYVRLYRAVWR